jgi:hypothetical protein
MSNSAAWQSALTPYPAVRPFASSSYISLPLSKWKEFTRASDIKLSFLLFWADSWLFCFLPFPPTAALLLVLVALHNYKGFLPPTLVASTSFSLRYPFASLLSLLPLLFRQLILGLMIA